MRQLTYTMHFRGQASPSAEDSKLLKVTSSGTSSTMSTVVGSNGVETSLQPAQGELAFLDGEIRLTGHEAFEGSGVLTFGEEGEHELRFATLSPGHLAPSAMPDVMAGTVSWKVDGGTGRFQSATGLVTSTFTLSNSGELSEYQCGLLFLPE